MAYDINNFVIDRIIRGTAFAMGDDKQTPKRFNSGDVLFYINQITNPSLSCTSESTDAVDALGTPIATFYRSKSAEFSAENAIFDMQLLATQAGTVKKVAGNGTTITAPCFQTIDVASSTSLTLSHAPKTGTTPKVYLLNGDGTLGEKISVATNAAARTAVAISSTTVTIVLNSAAAGETANGFKAGEQLFFMYEYDADGSANNGAVEVVSSATNFPVGCKFDLEVLGADVCDQTNLIHAHIIFPNAKLSPDFDWSKTLFLQAMLRI